MQPCEKPTPATLAEALALVAEQSVTIRLLQLQIEQLNRRLFGPTSEQLRLEDQQLPLLDGLFAKPEPPVAQEVLVDPVAKPRQPARRQPVPASFEVIEQRIEPPEKNCPQCGQACCVIREDRSDKFDLIPARLVCHRTIRPVLACPRCKEGVRQAPMPPAIVAKGVCSDRLIAYVICSKYLDHRPLYRVQQEFQRLGANLSRPVLCDAVAAAALALQPLWKLIRDGLVAGDYLQVDETPVDVLDPEVKGQAGKGWLWVYNRPGGDVLFDFRSGRDRSGPAEILQNFHGTLQSDGYSVYETLGHCNPAWKRLGCLAHARRKFHEAQGDDPQWAQWFLLQIGRLYLLERHLRAAGADPPQRQARRQQEATPILATIHQKLVELAPTVLPKSPLGKAVRYALGQWEYLQAYVEDGRYEIDQNLVENAIRPSCVGKKNWLFIGHPDAGWRSAVLYTLIVNCRRRNLDPMAWLTDVFQRLPTATNKTVGELLPSRWKKLDG
jgi:transposase